MPESTDTALAFMDRMVLGLAPGIGIPLPFMSHGGSSMLTNMICIGSVMMVDRWNRKAPRTGLLR